MRKINTFLEYQTRLRKMETSDKKRRCKKLIYASVFNWIMNTAMYHIVSTINKIIYYYI